MPPAAGAWGRCAERLQEEILRGTIFIDTKGSRSSARSTGCRCIAVGDQAFGTPTRISATARLGHGEVVDIQREVEQGGPIHSKGVLILSGFLGRRYARFQPLCALRQPGLRADLRLVEGDSASVAELCALLSAIGDMPPQAGRWPSPARSTSTARSRPSAASTKRSRAFLKSVRPGASRARRASSSPRPTAST